jgi:hypothetical protein
MVSPNEVSFNLRENFPLSRNICIAGSKIPGYTGQRTNQETFPFSTGYQSWLSSSTSPKISLGKPDYPTDVRDTAKSGIGCMGNRHLNYLVEFIFVNVGGSSYRDAKASSLPMPNMSVGGVIVLGARESRVHGEGR